MKRFVEGESRSQSTLLPESLDNYVAEDNSVRVVDAFIEELDLRQLGFTGIDPKPTGRPAYHPCIMLKIYVYGYLNRIQSSRRLEHETHRNVELMWLTGRLTPDFKTIADFRKDNGKAIRSVCKEFIILCRRLGLLSHDVVAIDGSKFKAVNSRDNSFTQNKMKLRIRDVSNSIDRYLERLDTTDKAEPARSEVKVEHLKVKLAKLRKYVKKLKRLEIKLQESPDKQVSLTDPDARSMKTMHGTKACYNVQTAVDAKHYIIATHEVTNRPSDRGLLSHMAKKTAAVMGTKDLKVLADKGYYKSVEILACDQAGITTYVPKPETSPNKAKGLFDRKAFKYDSQKIEYRCPAGEALIWRRRIKDRGMQLHRYWSSACQACNIKSQCTTSKQREVTRWEHEAVLDKLETRLDAYPEAMQIRKETVEHPYGTLKQWMGWNHFQMRELKNVKTEMSLHILAYNMKRVMNIIGMEALMKGIRA
jgi:transposase